MINSLKLKASALTATLALATFAGFLLGSTASADATLCRAPSSSAPKLGTLSVVGQASQLTTVQWGIEQGCYAQFGLNVKTAPVATTQIGLAGLVGRSYDVVVTTPTNLIEAKANGNVPIVFVAPRHEYTADQLKTARNSALVNGKLVLQTALIVGKNSSINGFNNLEHKKIALQSYQGADHAGLLLLMKALGEDASTVEFLSLPVEQMPAALDSGSVDGVIASEPFATQIIKSGGRVIGYPNAYFSNAGVAVAYGTIAPIAKKKAAALKAFQKATLMVNHLLNQPENLKSYQNSAQISSGITEAAAKVLKVPLMSEKNIGVKDFTYIVDELNLAGFITRDVDLQSMILK
jgi:NitT/TauT family transport system substrate-binding protein